jgi:hypothetical protein
MRDIIKQFLARILFLIPLITLTPLPGLAQQAFPEGVGRDAVFVSCTQCHGLDRLTRVSLNTIQWENALYDMMARGAVVDIKDLDNVRNYLVKNLAVDK